MKVHKAQFVREIPLFEGIGRRASYNADLPEFKTTAGVAAERGLQLTREREIGDEVLVDRVFIPYEQVIRWTAPPERRAKPADDGGSKKK